MIASVLLQFTQIDLLEWLNYPLIRLGDSTVTIYSVFKIFFWFNAVMLANVIFRRFLVRRLLAATQLDPSVQFAATRISGYLFLILGFYIALVVNGVNLNSLAVIAGALGVGIGFGLQNVVGNFVSGIILLAERSIVLGDRIEVAGVTGQVRKINLRSTVVTTNDNISVIVPNSELTMNPITNWSHGDPKVRLRLAIGVAYGTDVVKLQRVLLEMAASQPSVLKTPEPAVFFSGFGDSSLNFELALWTKEMSFSPRRFRSDINYAVERTLRENQIEIPFPQRVVHLRPVPTHPSERPEPPKPPEPAEASGIACN